MSGLEQAKADFAECERLENLLLTSRQRAYYAREPEPAPRWDLDPPMREEYDSPKDYVLAMGRYADRCLQAEAP